MTLDRRRFLQSSLATAGAATWWLNVPSFAAAKGSPELIRRTERPLNVHGLVEKPLSISLADLQRMPQVTIEAVLQCAGNGRGLFRPQVPGVQWQYGAMGSAEWTGVRLKDVLALARPKQDAAFLQYQGAERPTMNTTPQFIRAIPVQKAMHADTLV